MNEIGLNKARAERLEQKNIITSRLSETTRFVAFGVAAWVVTIHSSDKEFANGLIDNFEIWINFAGACALLAIALDYFHYLAAYASVRHALNRPQSEYKYDSNHPGYVLQYVFFFLKQATVAAAATIITMTFVIYVVINQ